MHMHTHVHAHVHEHVDTYKKEEHEEIGGGPGVAVDTILAVCSGIHLAHCGVTRAAVARAALRTASVPPSDSSSALVELSQSPVSAPSPSPPSCPGSGVARGLPSADLATALVGLLHLAKPSAVPMRAAQAT